jgi:hypothetical protein
MQDIMLIKMGPRLRRSIDARFDTTLTADGGGNFELPPGQVRAAMTGSPTAVYAVASAIR